MSAEDEIRSKYEDSGELPQKLRIPILKYFWQSSPLSKRSSDQVPNFLRRIQVLANFSDYELRVLSRFLHQRHFNRGETVFREGDSGFGFYFILGGRVEIVVGDKTERDCHVTTLSRFDYFGELALLQDGGERSATAIAKEPSKLLGIFKPDVSELIEYHPTVGAKLLQSISIIIANRLTAVSEELRHIRVNSQGEGT